MLKMNIDLTIPALREAYQNHTFSPRELIDMLLDKCDTYTDNNIWIHRLLMSEIEPYLKRLDKSDPYSLPLYGIPFAIKDNIDLVDVPTTAGCSAYKYIPEHSAFVVQQLIYAGAIPMGKTNMDQFATGLVGVRSPWGPCKNAFNKDYISGGSSAGSAVAVSLGLVSFALGTDTAGSGRVPAALNNIIGLKPSKGLLSMRGVVPACRSLDCVSIFSLTTHDVNEVFEIAACYDETDQYARKLTFSNNHRHYAGINPTFEFAVPQASQLEFFGNESAQHLFESSINTLEALGGIKKEIDFGCFLQAALLLYEGPWVAERYVAIEHLITKTPDALLPVINTIIGSGKDKKASDAFKAEYKMQTYRQQACAILAEVDFLFTPTIGTTYKIEEVQNDPIKLNSNLGYYTNYMNLLDCCGVAVPVGLLDSGLPFGVTLSGLAQNDRSLLSYAHSLTQKLRLLLGATQLNLQAETLAGKNSLKSISVAVCGAHLDGLALNWQLCERGARLEYKTTTAKNYRMYALPDGPPERPGLIRDTANGTAIEIEIWSLPVSEFGSFVGAIPAPLGIGKVELNDGSWCTGFICEAYGVAEAEDISHYGGWRKYIQNK